MGSSTRVLFGMAAFVVVVSGMRAASSILVPFLLALFIAVICAPLLFWLKRKGVPDLLAVLSVLVMILALGMLLAAFLGTSLQDFYRSLPFYQDLLTEKTTGVLAWLSERGLEVSPKFLDEYFNPAKAMGLAANTLKGVSGVFTNVFMIILTVVFILLEASVFPSKLQAALKDPEDSMPRLGGFLESLNRYLAIKTIFSLLTGVGIWLWLVILGVDYPILWGVLAFALNYIPNIGSIIAAVPASLLALVQLGLGPSLLTVLGYLVVNMVFGSILEPRFMGRGLGLSTLVVFLSLVFWGWVLGPMGMLLSVPLTMIVKIWLESGEDTRRAAILLGSGSAPAAQASGGAGAKEKGPRDDQE